MVGQKSALPRDSIAANQSRLERTRTPLFSSHFTLPDFSSHKSSLRIPVRKIGHFYIHSLNRHLTLGNSEQSGSRASKVSSALAVSFQQ